MIELPLFEERHRELKARVDVWAREHLAVREEDAAGETRRLVRLFGDAGFIAHAVGDIEVRSLCLLREALAYHHGLADFAFAMQGLGTGPVSLFGSKTQKQKYLGPVMRGDKIAAFAISEREAGSDIGALSSNAVRAEDGWILNAEKTWISNAGIADHYIVFTRIRELGEKAYGAFIVDADRVQVTEQIPVMAPHVLGSIRLQDARVSGDALIGEAGTGLKIALGTLDVFRTSVAAAALGFARRALDEALAHTRTRVQFGKPLAEFQLTQARLAEMALAIDAAALLIYRAAWKKDNGAKRITREAAMAKLFATEEAQKVIDAALQLHGGLGVVQGQPVERLYREIRALRIYEGTSEIQKLVIAAQLNG